MTGTGLEPCPSGVQMSGNLTLLKVGTGVAGSGLDFLEMDGLEVLGFLAGGAFALAVGGG
jgi:hypothetical protein